MVMAGNNLDPSGGSTGSPRADRQARQERTGGLIENRLIASSSVRPEPVEGRRRDHGSTELTTNGWYSKRTVGDADERLVARTNGW